MWTKLDDSILTNPKLRRLSDTAFRLWVTGLVYCNRELTDGFIDNEALDYLLPRSTAKTRRNAVIELCAADAHTKNPLWRSVEHGYEVHDFLQWNFARTKVIASRESARERAARGRANRWRSSEEVRANADETSDEVRAAFDGPVPSRPDKSKEQRAVRAVPRGHPAVSLYCELMRSKLPEGAKFRISAKAAGQLFSLTEAQGLPSVEAALRQYFADDDAYVVNAGYDAGLFCSKFAAYQMRAMHEVNSQRKKRDPWDEQYAKYGHMLEPEPS